MDPGTLVTAPSLAHVYTKTGNERRHFTLPEDEEKFRAWIAENRSTAPDPVVYERHRDIVLDQLEHMTAANDAGKYQLIAWDDNAYAPVITEHHRLTSAHLRNPESGGRRCWRCASPLWSESP